MCVFQYTVIRSYDCVVVIIYTLASVCIFTLTVICPTACSRLLTSSSKKLNSSSVKGKLFLVSFCDSAAEEDNFYGDIYTTTISTTYSTYDSTIVLNNTSTYTHSYLLLTSMLISAASNGVQSLDRIPSSAPYTYDP